MHDDLQVLGRAVKQAQYRQHRAMDSALSAVGTTLAQWDALRAIDRS
ncbi:MarR family transcriptional regulator, partial [Streptomyces hyaluromycini]